MPDDARDAQETGCGPGRRMLSRAAVTLAAVALPVGFAAAAGRVSPARLSMPHGLLAIVPSAQPAPAVHQPAVAPAGHGSRAGDRTPDRRARTAVRATAAVEVEARTEAAGWAPTPAPIRTGGRAVTTPGAEPPRRAALVPDAKALPVEASLPAAPAPLSAAGSAVSGAPVADDPPVAVAATVPAQPAAAPSSSPAPPAAAAPPAPAPDDTGWSRPDDGPVQDD